MISAGNITFFLQFLWSVFLFILDVVKLLVNNLIPYDLKSKKSVKDEIVLITGGGSGFGRELSLKFSRLGAKIVIWDVDEKGSQETRRLVEAEGGKIDCYILDISDRELVYNTAQMVLEQVGPVNILINNAGIANSRNFLETSDALLEKVMAVNSMAHFWTLKAFLPNMIENNHGHIVCVASMAGLMGVQRGSVYCSSKYAVVGLMESISMELIALGKTGVKTTVVCPFFSPTSLFDCKYDGIIPMVEPEFVAEQIKRAVLTDTRVLYIPWYLFIVCVLKVISTLEQMYRFITQLSGDALLKSIKPKTIFKEQEMN